MPGMATAAQLEALTDAEGSEAEQLYLELMIAHHQAGTTMAQAVLDRTDNEAVRALAQSIATSTPANGPGRSGRLSGSTDRPNRAKRAGSPFALIARAQDPRPASAGGAATARDSAKAGQRGNPALDTADWPEADGPGNLRVDLVLPSRDLTVRAAGVLWPGYAFLGVVAVALVPVLRVEPREALANA